jgi:hypothetical protein
MKCLGAGSTAPALVPDDPRLRDYPRRGDYPRLDDPVAGSPWSLTILSGSRHATVPARPGQLDPGAQHDEAQRGRKTWVGRRRGRVRQCADML